MRILVTGGAGFIGSHVVDRLLSEKHEVVVIDDFNSYYNPEFKRQNVAEALKNPNFKLIEGDICDLNVVRLGFAKGLDAIIHLAARAGVRASVEDPFLYQRVNVQGTLNILEAAREAKVKKMTFGSTSSVYGLNTKVPFSETDLTLNVAAPYAATKLAAESLCRAYQHLHGIDMAVLRFFSVYGPRGRPDMAIYQFSERILRDEPIPFFGDGSSRRDYTYVDDIVQGVVATLSRKIGYEIFNLGEAETVQLNDLIKHLENVWGKKVKLNRLPDQPGDMPQTYADISKAQKILGYKPQTKIVEGIAKFAAWFEKQGRCPIVVAR
jgi:UDP-glucuronate 4-epimerase